MLKVENLNYKNILSHISFQLKSGDICGVFGPSGAGKTTLLRAIKNFNEEWKGHITYNESKIHKYDCKIGYILQESIFFLSKNLMENLELTGASKDEIIDLLKEMNLFHLINKKVLELSGGEKQRLSICRTLLLKPKIILMDEPTAALDNDNVKFILNLVRDKIIKNNMIGLIISHNIHNLDIYNKFLIMKNG